MVFRRIHLVWVLVVIPAGGSMLTALQVLEQMTRVCLAAVRGPEVTPDKLMKKFPEVCSSGLLIQNLARCAQHACLTANLPAAKRLAHQSFKAAICMLTRYC